MNSNNSSTQVGHTPSKPIFENNANQSLVQVNMTNMIPSQRQSIHNVQQQNNISRRQEGRRRRRQRRRQREGQQRTEQQRRELPRRQRSRTWSEIDWEHHYLQSRDYPEYMEELNDELLEEYDLEKMDPKERWEQEQLNEFEGFAVLEQLLLIQDEIEQENQINVMEKMLKEEQLIQLQL